VVKEVEFLKLRIELALEDQDRLERHGFEKMAEELDIEIQMMRKELLKLEVKNTKNTKNGKSD